MNISMALGLFFGLLAISSQAQTLPSQYVGKIVKIQGGSGKVTVYRGNQTLVGGLSGGLSKGDRVVTAQSQTVSIALADGSEIMMGPDSDVTIEDAKREGDGSSSSLSIAYGMLRSLVKKVYSPKEQFNVTTPSSIMGVRGTDFVVEHDKNSGESAVHTLEGSVATAHNAEELKSPDKTVIVAAGTMTTVKNGQPIGVPQKFNYKTLFDRIGKRSPGIVRAVEQHRSVIRNERHREQGHGDNRHKMQRYRRLRGK